MQLSPRLAARPLRLLPPLVSATSGPRRHSFACLIKPQAPPRPDSTPSTRPPHPPSNFPELSSEACRLFSAGEVCRRRSPSKSPEAETLRAAQVSVTFRRLASQRSEDSVCPRVPRHQPPLKIRIPLQLKQSQVSRLWEFVPPLADPVQAVSHFQQS